MSSQGDGGEGGGKKGGKFPPRLGGRPARPRHLESWKEEGMGPIMTMGGGRCDARKIPPPTAVSHGRHTLVSPEPRRGARGATPYSAPPPLRQYFLVCSCLSCLSCTARCSLSPERARRCARRRPPRVPPPGSAWCHGVAAGGQCHANAMPMPMPMPMPCQCHGGQCHAKGWGPRWRQSDRRRWEMPCPGLVDHHAIHRPLGRWMAPLRPELRGGGRGGVTWHEARRGALRGRGRGCRVGRKGGWSGGPSGVGFGGKPPPGRGAGK